MEGREKSVIRANYTSLADDLIVNEDFYIALRQNKIFTDGMIANLKETNTPRTGIYKMLGQLEKRGPDAFENFIKVLEIAHPWLADKLKADYQKRIQDSTIEDVPRQDYTAYSDERTSNTPRKFDMSTTISVCPEYTIRKKEVNLSNSNSPNQSHKIVEESNMNRESERVRGPRYTQEVGNADNTDIQDKQDLDKRTYADACLSPIQILQSKPSAPMEAKIPNLNPTILHYHSKSDDNSNDIDDIIDNISSSQVFADNKKSLGSMAKIKDDDEDSDNKEVQTARDRIGTRYASMPGSPTQTTGYKEEPNLAEEDRDDKISEQDSEPDIDEEIQQTQRIHAKLQNILKTNQESHEQEIDQSNKRYEKCVTLDMIEDVVDSLQTTLQERFKIQKDELIEINEKLLEERKKVNEMVNDNYNKMKNMEKLNREALKNTKCANIDLKNKVSDLEKLSIELHKKNQDLEMALKTKQESAVEDKPPLATVTRKARRVPRDREISPRKSFNLESSRHATFNTLTCAPGMYPRGRSNVLQSTVFSPRTSTSTSRTTYGKKYHQK